MNLTPNSQNIAVGVGDIKVGKAPQSINTYLGSCVAVCLYAPGHKVGGMIHLMLPVARPNQEGMVLKKEKYADTGIPELFRQLKNTFGLEKEEFVAKIFGGANILKNVRYHIGKENITAVQKILKSNRIRIISSHTGGEKGYKIEFDLRTGRVTCRVFGEDPQEY